MVAAVASFLGVGGAFNWFEPLSDISMADPTPVSPVSTFGLYAICFAILPGRGEALGPGAAVTLAGGTFAPLGIGVGVTVLVLTIVLIGVPVTVGGTDIRTGVTVCTGVAVGLLCCFPTNVWP